MNIPSRIGNETSLQRETKNRRALSQQCLDMISKGTKEIRK